VHIHKIKKFKNIYRTKVMLAISVLRVNSANNLDGIGLKPVKLVNFL